MHRNVLGPAISFNFLLSFNILLPFQSYICTSAIKDIVLSFRMENNWFISVVNESILSLNKMLKGKLFENGNCLFKKRKMSVCKWHIFFIILIYISVQSDVTCNINIHI